MIIAYTGRGIQPLRHPDDLDVTIVATRDGEPTGNQALVILCLGLSDIYDENPSLVDHDRYAATRTAAHTKHRACVRPR